MKAYRFETREECEAWSEETNAADSWIMSGPVHKHDGQLFVQLYQGQHEWLAANLDDLTDVRHDPGYEGTVFGWAYIDREGEWLTYRVNHDKVLPEPDAEHPPITQDELLFGKKEQLESYLGMPLSELDVIRLPESEKPDGRS